MKNKELINKFIEFEFVDLLVQERLKEDYKVICKVTKELKNKKNLSANQKEDFQNDLELKKALEVLLSYYFTHDEYQSIMKNNK